LEEVGKKRNLCPTTNRSEKTKRIKKRGRKVETKNGQFLRNASLQGEGNVEWGEEGTGGPACRRGRGRSGETKRQAENRRETLKTNFFRRTGAEPTGSGGGGGGGG